MHEHAVVNVSDAQARGERSLCAGQRAIQRPGPVGRTQLSRPSRRLTVSPAIVRATPCLAVPVGLAFLDMGHSPEVLLAGMRNRVILGVRGGFLNERQEPAVTSALWAHDRSQTRRQ